MAEFFLDHNVAREIGDHLRALGYGARTSADLGMERAGDEEYVSLVARSDWILITHNAKDFVLLHAAWHQWSRDWGVIVRHAGILIIIPPVPPLQAAQEVDRLVASRVALDNTLYTWRRQSGWLRQQ